MKIAELIPAFLSDESARLKKRREIRKALQAIEAQQAEAKSSMDQRRKYAEQQDRITEAHSEKVAPIVARLAELREQARQALEAGGDIPTALSDEQAELFHKRNALNQVLEDQIGELRQLIEKSDQDRARINRETQVASTLRSQLSSRGVASPKLLLDRYVAQRALAVALGRRNSASEQLVKMEGVKRDRESRRAEREPKYEGDWPADLQREEDNVEWEITCIRAELAEAEAVLEQANAMVVEIRQWILDE
jgi:hypothetical protein